MRYKLLACKSMSRELSLLSALSSSVIDVTYVRRRLHDMPEKLNAFLQDEIDRIDSGQDSYSDDVRFTEDYDAILLGYGYCSGVVKGLRSKKYPLIVPKTNDCIALYLGSTEKYDELFAEQSGTYWYTPSWIEDGQTPSEETFKHRLKMYTAMYGEDNARYILDNEWGAGAYKRAAYIDWDNLDFPNKQAYIDYTKKAAIYLGWDFKKLKGSDNLLKDFIDGCHDDRFAVARVGQTFEFDDENKGIIKVVS